jgi:hypothetical protein
VLGARNEDPQAFAARGVRQPPLHPESAGDRLECLLQDRADAGQILEPELDTHEQDAFAMFRRMLVRMDDVRALIEQEARHS